MVFDQHDIVEFKVTKKKSSLNEDIILKIDP